MLNNRALIRLSEVEQRVDALQEQLRQIKQEMKNLATRLIDLGDAGVRLADIADGYIPGERKGTIKT